MTDVEGGDGENNLAMQLGVGYNINQHIYVQGKIQSLFGDDLGDARFITVNAGYRF